LLQNPKTPLFKLSFLLKNRIILFTGTILLQFYPH